MSRSTKLLFRALWHFGGLAAAIYGAWQLAGWPAGLIVLGLWAIAATMFDGITDVLKKI